MVLLCPSIRCDKTKGRVMVFCIPTLNKLKITTTISLKGVEIKNMLARQFMARHLAVQLPGNSV